MIDRFFAAAAVADRLLGEEAVAERWSAPSALAGMTVGGVAAHLASQATSMRMFWESDVTGFPVIDVVEHYRRSAWRANADAPANRQIADGSEAAAAQGPQAVLAGFRADVEAVRELAGSGTPDLGRLPWWEWSMPLGDCTTTRLLEVVVHTDDLAASVDLDPVEFGPAVADPVFGVLVRLAAERHGEAAVLRHLARRERAAGVIAAL